MSTEINRNHIEEDEIDLLELWRGIIKEKKALFIVFVVITILGVAFAIN